MRCPPSQVRTPRQGIDVLNAAPRADQQLAKSAFAFRQRTLLQIVAVKGEEIETQRNGVVVIAPVMQQVELRNAFTVETDNLGVDDRMTFEPRRILDNALVAIRPIRPVHGVEAPSAVTDVNL